jgi:hypothetical protein
VLKVLVLVALMALAIYLVVRTVQRGGNPPQRGGHGGQRRGGTQRRPPSRPIAPDDDLDFLRDLDRKRKHPDDPDNVGG